MCVWSDNENRSSAHPRHFHHDDDVNNKDSEEQVAAEALCEPDSVTGPEYAPSH